LNERSRLNLPAKLVFARDRAVTVFLSVRARRLGCKIGGAFLHQSLPTSNEMIDII
jgi:hypothetical protein